MRARQEQCQEQFHRLVQDALAGRFTVQHSGSMFFMAPDTEGKPVIENPKSGVDMEIMERYKLNCGDTELHFKWRGLESPGHSIPEGENVACSTFQYMEMELVTEKVREGGLHYLAGCGETFWYMLINFNTFGTVAPFHAPCHCNPSNTGGMMPPLWNQLRKKWDKIFQRAKENATDVQCMFSSTPFGCHNFQDCSYKHDIEIKKTKKK